MSDGDEFYGEKLKEGRRGCQRVRWGVTTLSRVVTSLRKGLLASDLKEVRGGALWVCEGRVSQRERTNRLGAKSVLGV